MRPLSLILALALGLGVACTDKGTDDTGGADGADGADGTDGSDGGVVDADGDGSPADEDCDDSDAAVFPGAPEVCGDGADNDCNAAIDCNDDGCAGDLACQPEALSVSPDMAVYSVAEPLQISGSGFATATAGTPSVTVGGETCASVTVVDDEQLTCTLTATSSGRKDVVVTTGNGAVTLPAAVAVYAPLYAASGRAGVVGKLYEIDPINSAVVEAGELAEAYTALAFAPDGTLYGLQATEYGSDDVRSGLLSLDPFTRVGTRIGDLVETDSEGVITNHDAMPDATFVGSTLLAWTEDDDRPTTVDLSTGAVTPFDDPGISSYGTGLAANSSGTTYLIARPDSGEIIHTVDASSGLLTDTTVTLDPSGITDFQGYSGGLSFFDGVLYSLDCIDQPTSDVECKILSVDLATGVLSDTGIRLPAGLDSLASIRP